VKATHSSTNGFKSEGLAGIRCPAFPPVLRQELRKDDDMDTFLSIEVTETFYLLLHLERFFYVEINLLSFAAVAVAVFAFRFAALKIRKAIKSRR
jgi:hypothetical protein